MWTYGDVLAMALGAADLVLCSGTLPRGTSFAERLASASDAGFHGISLWGRDVQAARHEGLSWADMAAMLADHDLVVGELDPAWWWTPGAADVRVPPELDPMDIFAFGPSELFAAAEALGARSLNAVDVFGGTWSLEEAAACFARLCLQAGEHGLLVHLEWLKWSAISDLRSALAVVEMAGARNGGVTIDAWHFTRTGTGIDDLLLVPGHRVLAVQLDDGPLEPEEDLIHATLHERLLPGRGAFDLSGILLALDAIGATAPLGVEVFSDDLHALGPRRAARLAAAAVRDVVATR